MIKVFLADAQPLLLSRCAWPSYPDIAPAEEHAAVAPDAEIDPVSQARP